MHIVNLTTHWSATTGGPSKYVASLQRELASMGHRVDVVTTDAGAGAEVATGSFPRRELRIIARLRELNPDILHVHGSVRLLSIALIHRFLRRRTRIVFTFHTQPSTRGFLPELGERRRDYGVMGGALARVLLSRADLVTSVSESIVTRHNQAYGLAIRRYTCIPSAGEPRGAAELAEAGHVAADGRYPVLVSVGVMAWDWKVAGHLVSVRAIDLLRQAYPGIRLLIAGDGPHRGVIEREVARLGVGEHVKLLGNVSPDPLLQAADVYIHMAMNEGCSLAIIEAMHAGKPIVAANAGGIPEVLVDGDSALLIAPEPGPLAAAVQGLMKDESRRRKLGERARELALEKYTWPVVARQYAEVYRSLMAPPGG